MPNQSIISVPANVTQPVELKRFIARLIEKLDEVLGFRGDDSYITQSQIAPTVTSLQTAQVAIQKLQAIQEQTITEIAESLTVATDAIEVIEAQLESTTLGAAYYDLDATDYATLIGNFEFSAIDTAVSNVPYTTTGGETYYHYFDCLVNSTGGVVQKLIVFGDIALVPTAYFRVGTTWTEAVTLGWN